MTVNVTDIQDYLTWRQNENAVGVRDMPHDYAKYRERLDQDERLEETITALVEYIRGEVESQAQAALDIYHVLTGVEYEPDDV